MPPNPPPYIRAHYMGRAGVRCTQNGYIGKISCQKVASFWPYMCSQDSTKWLSRLSDITENPRNFPLQITYKIPKTGYFWEKQWLTRHWPMAHRILNNSICFMSHSVMIQSWDSLDTVMRQSLDLLLLYSSRRPCRHVCSCLFNEYIYDLPTRCPHDHGPTNIGAMV